MLVGWLVGYHHISKTAVTILMKLGMDLQNEKVKKVTEPDFSKKFFFLRNLRKTDFLIGFSAFSRKLQYRILSNLVRM